MIISGGKEPIGISYDSILEYDVAGDKFREAGHMTQRRARHALAVVQYDNFTQWCQ